jgi:hypothetical protein
MLATTRERVEKQNSVENANADENSTQFFDRLHRKEGKKEAPNTKEKANNKRKNFVAWAQARLTVFDVS